MSRNYRKTKKSFVKDSNEPYVASDRTRKVRYYCVACKSHFVSPQTKKKHESKIDIKPRGIIEDIPTVESSGEPSQDTLIDLLEADTSSDNDLEIELIYQKVESTYREEIELIQEESYSFLLRKQLKDNSEGKKKGSVVGLSRMLIILWLLLNRIFPMMMTIMMMMVKVAITKIRIIVTLILSKKNRSVGLLRQSMHMAMTIRKCLSSISTKVFIRSFYGFYYTKRGIDCPM